MSAGAASPAVAAGWGALAGTVLLSKYIISTQCQYIIHYTGTVLGVGLSGTVNASMGLAKVNIHHHPQRGIAIHTTPHET